MGSPDINLAEEWIEWQGGTRKEAVSPFLLMEKTVVDPVVTTAPIFIGHFSKASEVTEVLVYLNGTSSPSVSFSMEFGNDMTSSGSDLVDSASSTTSTTPESITVEIPDVAADNFLWMNITAKSGTVYSFTAVVKYRTSP